MPDAKSGGSTHSAVHLHTLIRLLGCLQEGCRHSLITAPGGFTGRRQEGPRIVLVDASRYGLPSWLACHGVLEDLGCLLGGLLGLADWFQPPWTPQRAGLHFMVADQLAVFVVEVGVTLPEMKVLEHTWFARVALVDAPHRQVFVVNQ